MTNDRELEAPGCDLCKDERIAELEGLLRDCVDQMDLCAKAAGMDHVSDQWPTLERARKALTRKKRR